MDVSGVDNRVTTYSLAAYSGVFFMGGPTSDGHVIELSPAVQQTLKDDGIRKKAPLLSASAPVQEPV
jgi:hypothetical protein